MEIEAVKGTINIIGINKETFEKLKKVTGMSEVYVGDNNITQRVISIETQSLFINFYEIHTELKPNYERGV